MMKNYLYKVMLFLLIFSIPICGNWLFLLNNGELMSVEEMVDTQLKSTDFCLVGLATRNQGYYYKKEMYRRLKPEVLIHGSSRVMQFKGDYFQQPMLNTGGSMSSLNEGFSFLKEAFEIHKPKVMIMGIDYWWFNKGFVKPISEMRPPLALSHHISFRSYLLPYQWLWQKKVSFAYYFKTMNPLLYFSSHDKGIGLDGAMNRTGFAKDGSYYYTKTVTGKEKSLDIHFEHNLALVSNGDPRYEKQALVDEAHFERFLEMVAFIKANQVKVIFFIPPMAPGVESELKDMALIADLRARLSKAQIPVFDFHNSALLSTNDCEFFDATHGGDLLYAKILRQFAIQDSEFKRSLDTARLELVTKTLSGIAMVPKPELSQAPEIDFLELGCSKSSQYAFKENPKLNPV